MTTDSWPTLTEAATRTGYSREALRLRVRRGKLRSTKGNDGVLRVDPQELSNLPSLDDQVTSIIDPDGSTPGPEAILDDQGQALDVLRSLLEETRSDLVKAIADRLVDHGRAERAEAQLQAALESVRVEVERRTLVETRSVATEARLEAALAEARTPWLVRVVKALRRV